MGKVIGIDTSERIPNITILEKEKIVLMEKIEKDFHEDIPYFLEKKGIKPEELTGIGVAIGPGSFTGLRVGLSFATALSLALKIPIKGVITLEGMVASVEKDGVYFPMIYARSGTVFCGKYEKKGSRIRVIEGPMVKEVKEIREENMFGSGYEKFKELLPPSPPVSYFTSLGIARIAKEKIEKGDVDSIFSLEPLYLSPSEAERKRRGEVEIREMKKEDLPQVMEIERESFRLPWSMEEFLYVLSLRGVLALVACEDNKIIGYTVGKEIGDKMYLMNMAVRKGKRRRGIGKALLFEFIKECEKKGMKEIYLEVRISNEPAIELYKLFGFRIDGIIPFYYEDEDGVRMRLYL
mgnify:CR=1 FL=1